MCKEKITDISTAYKWALNLAAIQKLLEKCLTKVVAAQVKHYNLKHKPRKYNVGDFVYFNSQTSNQPAHPKN